MQTNPFDIPNMGLNQENPLFASMTMMRQMWESMAAYPMDLSAPAAAMPSAEELDKRIKDLKAVENWLRLNLSMLSSTIQGLEIQRSTLSAFNSFAQSGMAVMPTITEAMAQASQPVEEAAPAKEEKATPEDNPAEAFMQSGQVWWTMMQQQFDNLAQATTQSLQQTQESGAKIAPDIPSPSADSTLGKKKATKKTAAAKKTTAKKAAAKKTTSSDKS